MREEAEAWHDAESVDGRRRRVLRAVGRACARARSGGFMELMLDVPVVRFAGRPEVIPEVSDRGSPARSQVLHSRTSSVFYVTTTLLLLRCGVIRLR